MFKVGDYARLLVLEQLIGRVEAIKPSGYISITWRWSDRTSQLEYGPALLRRIIPCFGGQVDV